MKVIFPGRFGRALPRRVCLAAVLISLGIVLLSGCGALDPDAPGNLVPATVEHDPSLPRMDLNGTTVHLQRFGNAANPKMIFLHGGPGGDHRGLLRLTGLQSDYELIFWDQRSTGLSRRHDPKDVTLELYLQDLEALVDAVSPVDPVVLVGHSWGGAYATAYVALHPTRVSAVVLIDPGPFTKQRYDSMNLVQINLTEEWVNDYLWVNEFFSPDSHARLDFTFYSILGAQPGYHNSTTDPMPSWRVGVIANQYVLGIPETGEARPFDFTAGLNGYTGPALFLRSELNEIMPDAYMLDQIADYSGAAVTYVTIPAVGHDLPWVTSAQVEAEIRTLLGI